VLQSRFISVQLEPHPLTATGAVKKYNSGAKPDVQNRTIKKKQVLWSRIKNPGENVMWLRSRQSRIKILT
jgi:hypothetical protein